MNSESTEKKIISNLEKIKQQIADAEKKAGRQVGSVKLLAVSKFHPMEAVLAACEAGQSLFGENRIQEAAAKFTELGEKLRIKNQSTPELHIIGNVQRNKVRQALTVAACIEAVDRLPILTEIEVEAQKINKKISVFFELHTGEESKSGFESLDDLLFALDATEKMPHLIPCGFMTMAPFTDNESIVRHSFSMLREIAEKACRRFPTLPLTELSMGMSNDFRIAIEEGSTLVRVGTAIFGQRE
jgi:pyridoxal phosphate enzyme (YggS family)